MDGMKVVGRRELIETYWNVKLGQVLEKYDIAKELIETYWNVKSK